MNSPGYSLHSGTQEDELQLRFTLIIALAFLLTACATVPPPPAIPSPTPIAIPSLAPTPIPTPVRAPTVEATETSAATATSAPTEFPTPASTPTVFATLCDHPYYPVSQTAQWEYNLTAASAQSTYTKTITNLTTNSFTERRVFNDVTTENTWTCTSDGLTAAQFTNLNIHGQTQFKFDTVRSTGINFPPAEQWIIGKTWTNNYDVQGQLVTNGVTMSGTGRVDIQNSIVSQEQITVPAGTYTALRLDSVITIRLTPSGFGFPVTLTPYQTSWYARDVGLVKSSLSLNGPAASIELASYTR